MHKAQPLTTRMLGLFSFISIALDMTPERQETYKLEQDMQNNIFSKTLALYFIVFQKKWDSITSIRMRLNFQWFTGGFPGDLDWEIQALRDFGKNNHLFSKKNIAEDIYYAVSGEPLFDGNPDPTWEAILPKKK